MGEKAFNRGRNTHTYISKYVCNQEGIYHVVEAFLWPTVEWASLPLAAHLTTNIFFLAFILLLFLSTTLLGMQIFYLAALVHIPVITFKPSWATRWPCARCQANKMLDKCAASSTKSVEKAIQLLMVNQVARTEALTGHISD